MQGLTLSVNTLHCLLDPNLPDQFLNVFFLFSNSPYFLVPPNFNKPGGAGGSVSLPSFGGDARDVILNNPFSLYCETNAVPPPTLTWYKDGQQLTSNDNILILPGESHQLEKENKKDKESSPNLCSLVLRWASVTDSQGAA